MFMDMAGHRRRQGGAAALTLSQQVEAILAGTTGFALDPTDVSTMWQDSAKTTPVTAALDPVGAIRTKWGTAQFDILQSVAGDRPAWDGTRFLVPDGADSMIAAGSFDVIRNAAAYYIAMRHGGTRDGDAFFSLSGGVATTSRVLIAPLGSGSLNVQRRRLDADGASTNASADLTVATGTTFALAQDLAVNGVCALYRNNTFIENLPAIAGAPANGENTASARLVLFANMLQAFPTTTNMGRVVVLPRAATVGERATINSWLTEV
jgi:hypothetical protein